ncbi:hypothetical protein SLEP1_g12 [Rubroshorea leprosula]|uniref:mannan endo-1,4-beta-mannosidase n=1 Tax=Rubroshorea leprosula TaxID=152421 RepID=A0AAV5HFS4_9ROSI|nr:hypothetical protein SLEP1_g12 [Rubroshorea leprosula]
MKLWSALFCILLLLQGSYLRVEADDRFVTTRGVQLMFRGSPFYGNGFNAYWLMYMASDPSQRSKVSLAFQEARQHGLRIGRTWAFRDGGDRALQYSPGSYNEQVFQGLDFVISEAKKHRITLILSLVNNYDDYGGKKQYVNWARERGQSIRSDDDFFTNSVVKGYYKNHVKTVLTRRNTFTGVLYKDDPTIMAWELMNEPRRQSDQSGKTIQAWITEMASHVKSIDGKHLLEAGLEGYYDQSSSQKQENNPSFLVGTDFIANNQISGIDFTTVHSYPESWFPGFSFQRQIEFLNNWLNNHTQDAQNILHKPVLFAEFGKSLRTPGSSLNQRDVLFRTVYSAIYSSASRSGAAVGGLFWQLFPEGMDSFHDGNEVILSENTSTVRLINYESKKLNHIRNMHGRAARGIERAKQRAGNSSSIQGTNKKKF